jgi:hypothetical protein
VPDKRKNRGPHPEDQAFFGDEAVAVLRSAADDLSWLLSRGYARESSLKLVGDRYELAKRQRVAVQRSTCSERKRRLREETQAPLAALRGAEVRIDGYNVLLTIEAALSGAVLLLARDGALRDMASMHGNYRTVDQTAPSLALLGDVLGELGVRRAHWFLDQPVSNSGRLKTLMTALAKDHAFPWEVELHPDPDRAVLETGAETALIATADSGILDRLGELPPRGRSRWVNLARHAVEARAPDAWMVRI